MLRKIMWVEIVITNSFQLRNTLNNQIGWLRKHTRIPINTKALPDPDCFHTEALRWKNIVIQPVSDHYSLFWWALCLRQCFFENGRVRFFQSHIPGTDDCGEERFNPKCSQAVPQAGLLVCDSPQLIMR